MSTTTHKVIVIIEGSMKPEARETLRKLGIETVEISTPIDREIVLPPLPPPIRVTPELLEEVKRALKNETK